MAPKAKRSTVASRRRANDRNLARREAVKLLNGLALEVGLKAVKVKAAALSGNLGAAPRATLPRRRPPRALAQRSGFVPGERRGFLDAGLADSCAELACAEARGTRH